MAVWIAIYIAFIVAVVLMISFAGWYAVRKRHPLRSKKSALLVVGLVTIIILALIAPFLGAAGEKLWHEYLFKGQGILYELGMSFGIVAAGMYFVVSICRKLPTTQLGKPEPELVNRVKRMRLLLAAFYLAFPMITLITLALNFETYENNKISEFSSALSDFFVVYLMFLLFGWWPFLVLQGYFAHYIMLNGNLHRRVFVPILASLVCFSIVDGAPLWLVAFDIMETDFSETIVIVSYFMFFTILRPIVGLIFAMVGWFTAKFALKLLRTPPPTTSKETFYPPEDEHEHYLWANRLPPYDD